MRPALTVVADGRPVRLLADLVDKPWAAEDGQPWKATFPYAIEGAQSPDAELSVAPDVTVTLPAPDRLQVATRRESAASETPRTSTVEGEPSEAEALLRELAGLRDTQRRLQQRLDRMEADRAKTAQRLQELSSELREVRHEREELGAARDRIAAELEAVQRDRGEIVAERDRALRERHRMGVEGEATQRAHDAALRASEAASVARDHALAQRDAAIAARDEAVSARDGLSRTSEQLQSELADLQSARGAALVMRRAAQTPAVSRRYASIIPGAIMIAVVLAVAVILLVLLHVS
jgi:uncharacterized protein (DUF3084 family)